MEDVQLSSSKSLGQSGIPSQKFVMHTKIGKLPHRTLSSDRQRSSNVIDVVSMVKCKSFADFVLCSTRFGSIEFEFRFYSRKGQKEAEYLV